MKQGILIEEMQRNLGDAQNKSDEAEQKLNRILWEYIEAFDKERGRPLLMMTKLWQLMQSRNMKNLNVDKDLDKILSKIKQTGWSESTTTRRFWTQDEDDEQQPSTSWAQATDGKHSVRCCWMGLRQGDEGATGCLYANLHDGKREPKLHRDEFPEQDTTNFRLKIRHQQRFCKDDCRYVRKKNGMNPHTSK